MFMDDKRLPCIICHTLHVLQLCVLQDMFCCIYWTWDIMHIGSEANSGKQSAPIIKCIFFPGAVGSRVKGIRVARLSC